MKNVVSFALFASSLSIALAAHGATLSTTTILSESANPINIIGYPNSFVDLTADVVSDGNPVDSGVVSFYDITTSSYISGGGDVPLSNGVAQVNTFFFTQGVYQIEAEYGGSTQFSASNSLPALYLTVVNPSSSPVPLPGSAWLMLSGLGGLLVLRRKGGEIWTSSIR
jgi:hypothetical protein